MTWSLSWRYGGYSGTVDDIDVQFPERLSLTGYDGSRRKIRTDVWLPINLPRIAGLHHPHSGIAEVRKNGRIVLRGMWRDVEYGEVKDGHTPVTLSIAEDEREDTGLWPSLSDWRPVRLADDRIPLANIPEDIIWFDQFEDFPSDRFPPSPNYTTAATGYRGPGGVVSSMVKVLRADAGFSDIPGPSDGQGYPHPFGIAGTGPTAGWSGTNLDPAAVPASPGYIIDETGTPKILIADYPVDCSTCCIIGPSDAYADAQWADDGLDVHTDVSDTNGRAVSYVLVSDLTGVAYQPGTARYHVAWTGGAPQPGGAGDLLVQIMSQSSVRVDVSGIAEVRSYLNRLRLGGYVDTTSAPLHFFERGLGPLLPVSMVAAPSGIRPVLHPWVEPDLAFDALHLIDGRGVTLASRVRYEANDPVASVTLEYAYRPDQDSYSRSVVVNGTTSPLAAMLPSGGRVVTYQTRYVWDDATAYAMASHILQRSAWPAREVSMMVTDLGRYDIGGDRDLYPGRVCRLSIPTLEWDAAPVVVVTVERAADSLRVTFRRRDNPLRDLRVTGAAPAKEDANTVPTPPSLIVISGGTASASEVLYGADGKTFTAVSSQIVTGFNDARGGVVLGSTLWLCGQDVDLAYSATGAAGSWTAVSLTGTAELNAMATDGTRLVACGDSGQRAVCASGHTSAGNWTTYTQGGTYWTGVVWTGSTFIYTGTSGAVATNPDGTSGNDTARSNGLTNSGQNIAHIHYSSGLGVALIFNAIGQVGKSTDHGASWTEVASGGSAVPILPTGSADDGTTIIICGGTSTTNNQLLSSTDGATWSAISGGTGVASRPECIHYSSNLGLWIVGHFDGTVAWSTTGASGTWMTATGSTANRLYHIIERVG